MRSSEPSPRRRIPRLLGAAALVLVAGSVLAQSGLQITPDGKRTLVSKDVGAERWAITLDEDGSVTGNVFFPDGGQPRFVWCEQTAKDGGRIDFSCFGADRCPLAPCTAEQWIFIADVQLPEEFFLPPSPLAGPQGRPPSGSSTARPSAEAGAPSGLQEDPEDARTLISKDVGEERWAITRHLDDGSVTGNVFFPGGGEPRFVWCTQTGLAEDEVSFDCLGADRCAVAPCSRDDWRSIAQVTLPLSFFEAPANVTLTSLVETAVAALSEDGAFDAVIQSLDLGYSAEQIVDAILSGRLAETGEIHRRDGTEEPPDHPPPGLLPVASVVQAAEPRPRAVVLEEIRQKLADKVRDVPPEVVGQYVLLYAVLDLVTVGYSGEQVIEGILSDGVRFTTDPVAPFRFFLVDADGKGIVPAFLPLDKVVKPGTSPSPSPTASPTPTPSPGPSPSATAAPSCGNGLAEGDEDCDGDDLRGQDCADVGYAGGELRCSPTCALDESQCDDCGDGIRDAGEECDGDDLGGKTCLTQGFTGGTLSCTIGCLLATDECTLCGNSEAEGDEDCDGPDLRGNICENLGLGFTGGELVCDGSCHFDTSGCEGCGNGTVEGTEECDGANLGGFTCVDLGWDNGVLACDAECQWEVGGCCEGTPCGNDCYTPGVDSCCDDGSICRGGVCVSDGCCPMEAPKECVGTPYCCPLDWHCVSDGCCPPGLPFYCGNGFCAPDEASCPSATTRVTPAGDATAVRATDAGGGRTGR